MSTRGGPVTQVTHAGAERTRAACWSADGTRLFFASSAGQSFVDTEELWCVDVAGGDDGDGTSRRERIVEPRRCAFGPVHDACVRPSVGDSSGGDSIGIGAPLLVARNSQDTAAAHWKGTAADAAGRSGWIPAATVAGSCGWTCGWRARRWTAVVTVVTVVTGA